MDGWLDVERGDIRFELGRLNLPSGFSPPLVRLVSEEQLAAAAQATPSMAAFRAFVDWVGKGRALNDEADLDVDTAREVAARLNLAVPGELDDVDLSFKLAGVQLIFEWAALAGFVFQRGSRLYRTRMGKAFDRDPLAAWQAMLVSLFELGVVDVDGNGPPWGSTVDDSMADLVVAAHLRAKPIAVQEVVDDVCEHEADLFEHARAAPAVKDGLREAIAEDVRRICDALAAMGVIATGDGFLRSTPLGAWASVLLMNEDGLDVHVTRE